MKKQVLLTGGILITGLLCAQTSKKISKIPARWANITAIKYPTVLETGNSQNHITTNPVNSGINKTSVYTTNVIGKTYYDLQTNSCVGDRIVVNADGSIATVWTMDLVSGEQPNYLSRGTGYAYYNGTSWSAAPTSIVEPVRVGWGNIVNTRSGKELILSHHASGLNFALRSNKGTGAWTNNQTLIPNVTASGTLWPRMVNSGDTVYSIGITTPVASGGTTYNGLDGALVFSRSKNAGVTWDIVNQIPTGLTAANFLGFGGDGYAIAAKGSTVVIVAGDATTDIVMTKSTDGGATWTPRTVYKFPIHLWNSTTTTSDIDNDAVPDTIETNDGSLSVALDNNNNAYVSYGRMRILVTTPVTTSRYTYFATVDGLFLWDESKATNMGGKTIVGNIVAAIQDLGADTVFFPDAPSGALPFGRWQSSLTSYPSMAFDASNTLYLSYSSVVDSLMSIPDPTKLVRHVYVIKSSDGGVTFTDPCDIVGSPNGAVYEGMFASMAKRVDGNVHLTYQRDFGPGSGIPGDNPGDNPDELINTDVNDIVYFKFPVSEIGACSVDVGIKEQSSAVSGLKFYPNPASTTGTLEITLNDNSKMDISILNNVGQVVYTTSVAGNAGKNKVDLNLNNLSNGMYFYQVKAGNTKTVTNKFIVAK